MPLPENIQPIGERPHILRPLEDGEVFTSNKETPLITIVSPSYNLGNFLEDTIISVARQSFKNFEHLIIDNLSTDNTKEIIDKYPHVTFISEPDSGVTEGINKGIRLAKGKYVMILAVSDGLLDTEWLINATSKLESDDELSLVWGLPRYLTEEGVLGEVAFMNSWDSRFTYQSPPNKKDWFQYWLNTGFHFTECNMVVRKEVYEFCFPKVDNDFIIEPYLEFSYIFNTNGYLSEFINIVANFGRTHNNQLGEIFGKKGLHIIQGDDYTNKRLKYLNLISSGFEHKFKDSLNNTIL
jgi:glycosyltransferase involved in cell wall biosynthesis